MSEIIININEANKAQKYQNENELFQIEAFKRVSEILKEHKVGKDIDDITDCRFHDTIFIDGDRGVGKTAFMINIENYYKNIAKIETPKYIFLKPVDPTLLEHTEKFLSVVLARIVEMVSKKLKNSCIDEENYCIDDDCNKIYNRGNKQVNCIESYYKALEKLSKSLEAIKTLEKDVGIEEIASNKSSLKLEQHAHEFFQVVCKMFGANAIVMLIDDVDMAFDKGFDVLEVVRKYLASPYLIPIVAGDMKLYREIVETRFKEKIQFFQDVKYLKDLNGDLKNSDEYKEKMKLLNNLVEQYLHKVFPSEYHIKLKDIFTILKEHKERMKIEINGNQVSYEDLKDFEIRVINWGINQKEFTHQVFTNNTRDFVQYLYHKKEIYEKIFDKDYKEKSFKEKNEKSYTIITDRFDELIKEKIIKNPIEHKKTLKLTADFYRYSNDIDKKRLSLLLDNDVEAFVFNKENKLNYSIHKALRGNFFLNEKLPYNKIDKEVVRDKLYLPKKEFLKRLENKTSSEYLALYLMLHDNYYSNTTNKILMITGKFMEAMICIIDNSLTQEEKKEKINTLNYEIPFLAGINKNKYIHISNPEESEDEREEQDENKDNDFSNGDYLNFVNFFNESFDLKFTSIFLYEMLKKYINNLNVMKVSDYSKDYEFIGAEVNPIIMSSPLYDYVKRVCYIFLNSIASFESRKNISINNIAVDKKIKNIKTHSKVYVNNIFNIEEDTLTNYLNKKLNEIVFKDDLDEILNKVVEINKKTIDKKELFNSIFYRYWQKVGYYKKGLPQMMNPIDICKNYFREINKNIDNDSKKLLTVSSSKYVLTYKFIKENVLDKDNELETLMKKYQELVTK